MKNKMEIDREILKEKGIFIGSGVSLECGVEIGENSTILSYDQASKVTMESCINTGARIGSGSVVYPGVIIGASAVVCPGSVVTRSVPPLAIVQGNPATIIGYSSTIIKSEPSPIEPEYTDKIIASSVKGVSLHHLPLISDLRGDLSVGEFENHVPFSTKRYFLVFSVPTIETRGEHAHKTCKQFLICVAGNCKVIADDGENREEFVLDKPNKGLYLPAMTWGIQYQYSSDAVLLVFASDSYDPGDYIRDYEVFSELTNQG